jgi:hypothetical protein
MPGILLRSGCVTICRSLLTLRRHQFLPLMRWVLITSEIQNSILLSDILEKPQKIDSHPGQLHSWRMQNILDSFLKIPVNRGLFHSSITSHVASPRNHVDRRYHQFSVSICALYSQSRLCRISNSIFLC